MTWSYAESVNNAKLQAIIDQIDAGAGVGRLRLYSGTEPANVRAALGGAVLLSEHNMSDPSAPAPTLDVLTFNAISTENAIASGTPTFGRVFNSDGTTALAQGTVGTEITVTPATLTAGQPVSVPSAVINSANV